ncbi:unnamed protein product, partial [Rotaria magnacalcarata]
GFILAIMEGSTILISRYSQMFISQPAMEEPPIDMDKGKVDVSLSPIFSSSSAPGHFS